ncbi:hypothetical protein MIDIC_410023 [Alphaproteobacteria bacterium]
MSSIDKCLATQLVSFLPELGDKSYISNELSATVNVAPYARDSGRKQGRDLFVGKKNSNRLQSCQQLHLCLSALNSDFSQ